MAKKRYYDGFGKSGGQAHMPQDVVMKYYGKDGYYLGEYYDDGISGIDKQRSADGKAMKKNLSPTKY